MASFSLDDIRAAADRKYGSTDITLDDGTEVVLRNPLRLSKSERKELGDLQKQLAGKDEENEEDEADIEAVLADSIVLVAKDASLGRQLIREIDGDLAVLLQIFKGFNEETEMGEASASQS